MGFSRQECWNGLPFPPPGDRPYSGIQPVSSMSPALQVDSLPLAPSGKSLKSLESESEVAQLCVSLCDPMDYSLPWTIAYQVPLSMGFSRQYSWSGLPFTSPGDLPNPGIKAGYYYIAAKLLSHFNHVTP